LSKLILYWKVEIFRWFKILFVKEWQGTEIPEFAYGKLFLTVFRLVAVGGWIWFCRKKT
jgi:hypothetical protein